jgi:hypothetical protein
MQDCLALLEERVVGARARVSSLQCDLIRCFAAVLAVAYFFSNTMIEGHTAEDWQGHRSIHACMQVGSLAVRK